MEENKNKIYYYVANNSNPVHLLLRRSVQISFRYSTIPRPDRYQDMSVNSIHLLLCSSLISPLRTKINQ